MAIANLSQQQQAVPGLVTGTEGRRGIDYHKALILDGATYAARRLACLQNAHMQLNHSTVLTIMLYNQNTLPKCAGCCTAELVLNTQLHLLINLEVARLVTDDAVVLLDCSCAHIAGALQVCMAQRA